MEPKIKVLTVSVRSSKYAFLGFSRFDKSPDSDDHINFRHRQYNTRYISTASITRFLQAQENMNVY